MTFEHMSRADLIEYAEERDYTCRSNIKLVGEYFDQIQALTQQRDQLLAALEWVATDMNAIGQIEADTWEEVRSAIAQAKGE
jgi:hypothetical protein